MSKKRFTKNCSALEMSFIEDGLEEAFSAVQQRVDNSAAETESIQKTQLVLCIMIRGKITNVREVFKLIIFKLYLFYALFVEDG